MPSQSSLEGESMPDHWTTTVSPDFESVVGFRDIEACWVCVVKKKKNVERMKIIGIAISSFSKKEINHGFLLIGLRARYIIYY